MLLDMAQRSQTNLRYQDDSFVVIDNCSGVHPIRKAVIITPSDRHLYVIDGILKPTAALLE